MKIFPIIHSHLIISKFYNHYKIFFPLKHFFPLQKDIGLQGAANDNCILLFTIGKLFTIDKLFSNKPNDNNDMI